LSNCALCGSDGPLKDSHIIPSFVSDKIKNNSPAGFLRGGIADPNMRRQDGDKLKLLCGDCEQRFSIAEKKFAEEVFAPYHETGQTAFQYEDWLSYFICSVNWRTLHLVRQR
jgi:5-methylcytosine-specific restriction endonuclease McrA